MGSRAPIGDLWFVLHRRGRATVGTRSRVFRTHHFTICTDHVFFSPRIITCFLYTSSPLASLAMYISYITLYTSIDTARNQGIGLCIVQKGYTFCVFVHKKQTYGGVVLSIEQDDWRKYASPFLLLYSDCLVCYDSGTTPPLYCAIK